MPHPAGDSANLARIPPVDELPAKKIRTAPGMSAKPRKARRACYPWRLSTLGSAAHGASGTASSTNPKAPNIKVLHCASTKETYPPIYHERSSHTLVCVKTYHKDNVRNY